jgi:hypothetical protein
MGEYYELSPAQLAHMQAESAARLLLNPEPARSPYYIPPRMMAPPVPAEVSSEPAGEPVLTAGERAKAFLLSELAADAVASLELQGRAREAGIAWRTIRRVAKAAGAKVFKRGRGEWMWSLKDDQPDDGQE